jgi:hypothetical protein
MQLQVLTQLRSQLKDHQQQQQQVLLEVLEVAVPPR